MSAVVDLCIFFFLAFFNVCTSSTICALIRSLYPFLIIMSDRQSDVRQTSDVRDDGRDSGVHGQVLFLRSPGGESTGKLR